MSEKVNKNWTEDAVATLVNVVGSVSPVTAELVNVAAEQLGKSTRSITAKLRQLDYEVVSMAKEKTPAFTDEESLELSSFVNANAGNLTYKDIAEKFLGGKFSPKQIQGKLLALELTGLVKPAEKVEAVRTYTADEEATFIQMANAGKFIEDIAEALGKDTPSVRGKALSLLRSESISKIPAQRESHAKNDVDPVTGLGDAIATMTVADIAKAVDKTERGIKTLLTRRGIDCADYKGSAKKAKAEGKRVAA